MSELAINASEWRSAEWAKRKGLYTDVYEGEAEMDIEIERLTMKLSQSNPEAMALLKRVFWEGTEAWETLLLERAGMSGKLVLSDFTVNAIQAFKKK
jgi:methylglutaconyl-CoA hydratase